MSTLIYHDADGNEVPEGSPSAVVQYRSDDPARPKAAKATATAAPDESADSPLAGKAVAAPPENKAVKGSPNK